MRVLHGRTCDSRVFVIEGLLQHELFRLSDSVQHDGLPVVSPVRPHSEADLTRIRIVVERICIAAIVDKCYPGSTRRVS